MAIQDTIEDLKNLDVGDLNWERIGVWPLAGRLFFWVLAAGLIIGGAYWFFVKDLNVELQAAVAKEATLKKDFDEKVKKAALLDQYIAQMAELDSKLEELKAQLPDETEVPGLVDDIDEKGVASGLKIEKVRLESEKKTDFYVELPISIAVSGAYHDIGAFVSGVAGMPRIVTLHDFKITKKDGVHHNLQMTIQAKTYRILDEDEDVTVAGGKQ